MCCYVGVEGCIELVSLGYVMLCVGMVMKLSVKVVYCYGVKG